MGLHILGLAEVGTTVSADHLLTTRRTHGLVENSSLVLAQCVSQRATSNAPSKMYVHVISTAMFNQEPMRAGY